MQIKGRNRRSLAGKAVEGTAASQGGPGAERGSTESPGSSHLPWPGKGSEPQLAPGSQSSREFTVTAASNRRTERTEKWPRKGTPTPLHLALATSEGDICTCYSPWHSIFPRCRRLLQPWSSDPPWHGHTKRRAQSGVKRPPTPCCTLLGRGGKTSVISDIQIRFCH